MKMNIKTTIGIILSTLFIIFFSIGFKYYLINSSNELISKIDAIENSLLNKNFKEAEKQVEDLKKSWHNTEKIWSMLIDHREIDTITSSIKSTKQFIKFHDLGSSTAGLDILRHYINHIPSMEELNLKNFL